MEYEIRNSFKARRVRITIYSGGKVIVTKPRRVSVAEAEKFASAKQSWIKRKLEVVSNRQKLALENSMANKTQALEFVRQRIAHFNQRYQFAIGRISVKNHKSLWGSCSRQKNLNFNQRIILLPPHQADYIIVHELCHCAEFNHSQKFWKLVSETIPNFKIIRQEMKNYSFD